MGLLGAVGFSLALVSLTQIHHSAEASSECKILSAIASSASSILVTWEKYPGATMYFVDLRKRNFPDSAPVVVSVNPTQTQQNIQGLTAGTEYNVTLKVFRFHYMKCVNTTVASTVPSTPQIVDGWAVSSTSITVKWKTVPSAEHYYLMVYSQVAGLMFNLSITNTSAVVGNLQPSSNYDCYVYTANKAGMGSRSKVRTITTLVQPPIGITVVQTGRDTARIRWQPVDDVLLYKCTIRDLDEPTSQPSMHNVTDVKLDVKGIFPCSNYLISVHSFSKFLVLSESTDFTYTTNKLTPVSSVSADYSCVTNSAMVSWSAVFGASLYQATAIGDDGHKLTCTSQSTSCQIVGLSCSLTYVVEVTPMSENCKNLVNASSATFQTVPCPPGNLTLLRECISHVITFSWNPTNNTDHYLARATDSEGIVQDCLTEDNSCYFTHTVCGQHYDFTVYSVSGFCRSELSSIVGIRTAPCIPQNLQSSGPCSSDILLSTWDHADGALNYTVQAIGNKRNNSYKCSSQSNSCSMMGVQCGEHLSVTITAFDEECPSAEMLGMSAQTVPCPPTNVSAVKECETDSIAVRWHRNSGAFFYVAKAEDSYGVIHSCQSIDITCKIDGLKCSTNYKVYVIASNYLCNSTESETLTIETAACPPDNITFSLDCAASEALISWHSQPQMNSFTATIVDENEGLLSCSSTTNNCKVPNLKCGQLYTVTVSHHDGTCSSMPSAPIYMDSVRCGPTNVHANVDCASGNVTISWNASPKAEHYLTTISDMAFHTEAPELSLSNLGCGIEYTVKVMSVNESCVSVPTEIQFREAPCVPSNVTTQRNCGQNFVEVTWQASRGAKNYTATAVNKDGYRLECVSNETRCRLEGVMCSQTYNISVVAVDDNCTSMKSVAVELQIEPCPPSQLTASVNCTSNSAKLTWNSSSNAVSYTGKAVSADGHNVTCDAGMGLGCFLEGLQCSEEYAFTVSASYGYCQSADSEPVVHTTAPCAVENVLTNLNCSTNILTISWGPGPMPVNYSTTAAVANGTALQCVTEGSSCTMTPLQCGQQYTVTVQPGSSTCEGPSSVPQIVNSVPCVPMNIQSVVDCSTNTLQASWDAAAGAASYISTLKGPGGFSDSCTTMGQRCPFPDLLCAQTYMFSVVAVNDRCNSSKSTMISATTAPCDPTNVTASLNCSSGVATVTWGASAGANHYTVVAEASGHVDVCKSAGTSCQLTQLQCGEDYTVTVLAGDAKCNSSILVKTNVVTAPCAPEIQNHSLDCVSNNASISWVAGENAESVTVTATSLLGEVRSCSSATSNSCVLDHLPCGRTFTAVAVAQGVQCSSKASSAFQIVTGPCTPSNVEHQYSCGTGIAFVSWDETLGRKTFHVLARSGNVTAACSTSQTDCSLPALLCGRTYSVEVTAVADHCNSSVPGLTKIQTAPCEPMNVSVSLLCDNNTAVVSWRDSPSAMSYNVMASGRDGDTKRCTTNTTSCLLPNMHCAQTYIITVTPFSKRCKGRESLPRTYIAGPCPPTNVQVSLQCVGNVGHVSWTAALQADMYVASTVPAKKDQHFHNCSTVETSCSITDLHCSETHEVIVVTVERGCTSEPSTPVIIETVICPPAGLTGVTSCSNNDITVSWDPRPESGVDYFLHKQNYTAVTAVYNTTQTSQLISPLPCGEMYTFAVAAAASGCTSVLSQQIETETAPCPPTNLTVKTDCGTNTATLSWSPSAFATSYTATVTSDAGRVVSCSTNTTSCSVTVDCGTHDSAVVVAFSATCDSRASAPLTFTSAPCLPDDVQAELDCDLNTFAVRWQGVTGGDSVYTAIAIGSDGTRQTCNSTETQCSIRTLTCGLLYSIVITTSSVHCGTIEGSNYKLHSAPCTPDSVLVDLQCSTNVASVTWGNSGPDQSQVVTAVDSRGMTTTRNTNSSNYTFDQLTCGNKYSISVVGRTDTCSSKAAEAKQLNTAPCVPTHVTARVDCQAGITGVTWDAALGATSYTVYARGSLGHNAECNNTDTSCNFPNLACGQDYNITVVARHDTCVGLVSESTVATTGPCPHGGLKTTLDCDSNTAVVSWTPGRGILYYNASADAFKVVHKQTCSTHSSSCNITSLPCGESYKITVNGQGQKCPSPGQDWQKVNTAPCAPTHLRVNSSCESNNIVVSWQASRGSASYRAVAENTQGRRWSCNSSSTSCQISGLLCGQKYKVYVVGVDDNCIGAKSEEKMIRTAPCVPQSVQNDLDCLSGVLNVTWRSTGYLVDFRASVVSSEGHVSVCTTKKHHCVVRNMKCGLTYNVTVVARDEACNSSRSPVERLSAAPCPPPSILPALDCDTGVVSVTWNHSVEAVVYTVSAVDASGRRYDCNGTYSSCSFGTLECGTEYNVTITPSRNGCVGRNSPTKMIRTVPCVPHLSEVEVDCLFNSAWVMYNPSAGAEDYVVMATDRRGNVRTFECNSTSDGTCALPPLACSQNLTFTLKARDEQCASAASDGVTAETAPCPPENVTESVDCDDGTITVAWSAVAGAVSYTATLDEISGGATACCTASDTSCDVAGLPCGDMYVLHVTAQGRTCNSSESREQLARTVPCVPENLEAGLSCRTNVASMTWNYSKGGQFYKVEAVSADGHQDGCSSPNNRCDLTRLRCGQYYTATVTAEDIVCRSEPGGSVTIKTVPCTPENVSSVMSCDANALVVSWSESSGADSYIATMQGSDGQRTSCQAMTEGSCNVTGLGCGQILHVAVVSSDGFCDSPPSPSVDTPSVPCKPRHIKAVMDCYTKTAVVSWYPSDGAERYVVWASAASLPNVTCETKMAHCELEGIMCGQSYSVSVKAVGETCCSIGHMTAPLVTAPCFPEQITTQYSVTIGQVQWDRTAGADYYTVTGETDQGLVTSCRTVDTYCPLYNMNCGQIYDIKVTANNHVCEDVSVSTENITITTEPCPPNHVQASVDCQDNRGTVSWEASAGAASYVAHLAGRDGHSLSCSTGDTFCSVTGLHCGVTYHTNVIAVGETLNSSTSTSVLLISAPCTATNVAAHPDCSNNRAEVSWSPANGANFYRVTAASRDAHPASCQTDGRRCNLTELECGRAYDVTVESVGDRCQTETHAVVTFSTRPCEPRRVGVDRRCGTSTAVVYWEEVDEVELYVATAAFGVGTTLSCNSTDSTCQFSNLDCGMSVEFSVAAYTNTCRSETSSAVVVQTEPCQPTDLVAFGLCDNGTVTMVWSEARGALFYEATATGDLGYTESFRSNTTWSEVDLPCGQLFTFTVTAYDERCRGAASPPARHKTGVCVPRHVQSYTRCEDSLGAVSWAASDGSESYLAVATGRDGHNHTCPTTTAGCTWDDLHCGEEYTVYVVAMDNLCTSTPSDTTSIRMAPCIPQNLVSSLDCTTKVASLSWNASETAEFYIVTAENNGGHQVHLSTNDTWTFISELKCSEEYFLSVRAADSECTSRPSPPSKLLSEPCPPTGISSSMNCVSNIAVVTWTGSAGMVFYTATLMPEDGQSKSCWSDSEQCGMPNVLCGQNYSVTVVASNGKCDSDPSEADTLQSVPCVPADVHVEVDCSTNEAVVSWSASDGALLYKVAARSTRGAVYSCETGDLACTLTNLTCGQRYAVQVVAEDDVCSSLPSPAVELRSVPCTPNIGSVVLDCVTNSALLDWTYAEGALFYTATARSSGGNVSTCSSNFTNCELSDLQCGQTYDVVTVASNDQCSSPPSSSLQVESVPCPPEDVTSVLNCSTNAAWVGWQTSRGADSYIVQALGVEEHATGCETARSSCSLSDLMCGFTYNISVIAVNSVCNVSQSVMKQLQTVPCVPQQVEARVVCESGAVAVSWEPSKGALFYETVAQGNTGHVSICNSIETTCLLDGLLCGLNYSITVSASDDTCRSAESSPVEIDTVPCAPQKVRAEMVCSNDTAVVSWEEGEGVSSYEVWAFGPDGHKTECTSTETSCELPSMHCGQLYHLTVTAQDGRCDNSNVSLDLQSAPCKPTSVKASLRCRSNSVAVTWERASGALSYLAAGVTADGSLRAECNNTATHCDLSELRCGRTYDVSVFGQDESCSGAESDAARVRTAPCVPQDVTVHQRCADKAMVVSWSPNPDAQSFHVTAVSDTRARLHCNSTGTSCTLRNLPCGQSYNVTVRSERDGCESEPSAAAETSSAPCTPMNPEARLDCVSNSAWVIWSESRGATGYSVVAREAGGHSSNCTSGSSPCSVPDLKCGSNYTFHVTAANTDCRSNHTNAFNLETGPCGLKSISAVTECNNDTILVEWETTVDAPLYLVTAEADDDDRTLLSCNSSSDSCVLKDVRCATRYSIIVSSSSDKCSSLRSPPKKIQTAPCVPGNVTVTQSCGTNAVEVMWANSPVATRYRLTATGRDGLVHFYNTTTNNCSLPDLHCGETYRLIITAVGDNCVGPPGTSSFRTAPCALSGLSVVTDCRMKSAVLSWMASEGAVAYVGRAEAPGRDPVYCDSTSLSCTIEHLECGDLYNFSVKALDGVCRSSFSAPVQAGVAPCAPVGLKVRMLPIDERHWTMMSWDRFNCSDVEYQATVIGRIENNPRAMLNFFSYWLPRPYFEMPMPCSTPYNITLRARNSGGVSEPSGVHSRVTVPCPPQNLRYSRDGRSVVLSWDASLFATSYAVYGVSGESRERLCITTGLSCSIRDFVPSATEVTASNAEGESGANKGPVEVRRKRDLQEPWLLVLSEDDPEIPEVTVTVMGRTLYVKWTTVKDAIEYRLVIEEELSGRPAVEKDVAGDSYVETDLKPRTTYCVTVVAKIGMNQSSRPKCLNSGAS